MTSLVLSDVCQVLENYFKVMSYAIIPIPTSMYTWGSTAYTGCRFCKVATPRAYTSQLSASLHT